jgi:protein O-mannosyl-transferase
MAKRSKKKKPPSQTVQETVFLRSKPFNSMRLFQALLIVAAVFWIYWPVLHGGWLNWDDDTLISKNDLVHDPFGIVNIWFEPSTLIDYFPLTVSLEWLEWQLWPDNPFCYHLTNVVLHALSALLVWHLFGKLGLRLAWLGGLLFAIHPVMVESVAWITELKNTLSLPPFLLAMCAWIDYERRGRREDYFLALALFLIAMLCKTTMVMFPVIILLYAWWRRGRIGRPEIQESLPFFAISLVIGLTLIAFMRHGVGEQFIPLGGVLSRLACGGLSLAFYFSKCVLPVGLLPIYPQWDINPPSLVQFLPWPVLGLALYWLWTRRAPWSRNALFGFGFFLINLAPFVGFRAISFMRFVWVMDHFLYLPILGLLALAVAAFEQLDDHLETTRRTCAIGALTVIVIMLAVGSHRYAKTYVDSETLWTYTTHRDPSAWPAHNDLGNVYLDQNRLAEAKIQYEAALRLNPIYPEAHNNLAIILAKMGRLTEAESEFQAALQLQPDLVSAQDNLTKVQTYLKAHPTK